MSGGNAVLATLPPAGNVQGDVVLPAVTAASIVSPYAVTSYDGSYKKKAASVYNQANAVQTVNQSIPTLPFSEEQIQRLLCLVGPDEEGKIQIGNRFNFVPCSETWIIETGASRHMIGCPHFLFDSSPLQGDSLVFIPNGKSVQATHIGSARLGGNLVLSKVLFVSNFDCNLKSVARLSEEMNCQIIFSSDLCLIQDRMSRRMIGIGELMVGISSSLYCSST
ncbi:hypothetical protein CRG98_006620 [Punica granatum]|uniref:Retrovirus-related Pol polyprotein from transposon TNT 1-94-like beta-barrel domain-containing protein n=1 Tax=Punica granatum TaxID=22663 RepID=A0A2I0KX64_PUNGR|nr:hypothetical protein CRG98_006620 [Punica granatum]